MLSPFSFVPMLQHSPAVLGSIEVRHLLPIPRLVLIDSLFSCSLLTFSCVVYMKLLSFSHLTSLGRCLCVLPCLLDPPCCFVTALLI
jgi:hypothetical protein